MKRISSSVVIFVLSICSTNTFSAETYAKLEMGPQFPASVYPEYYNNSQSKDRYSSPTSTIDASTLTIRRGNIDPKVALGLDYLTGNNRAPNEREAFRLFQLAEKEGSEEASVYLASMYYYGQGTSKNYEEAFQRLKRTAASGNSLAQYNLHIMYDVGYGVLVDKEQALHWLTKSAENGFVRAQTKLGMLYKTGGRLVHRDLKEAVAWLHRAADNGDKEGQFQLAKIYAMGIGARKNHFISYIWFNIAGENCDPGIQLQQCMAYTRSIETMLSPKEISKAKRLIRDKKNMLAQKSNNLTFEKVIIH